MDCRLRLKVKGLRSDSQKIRRTSVNTKSTRTTSRSRESHSDAVITVALYWLECGVNCFFAGMDEAGLALLAVAAADDFLPHAEQVASKTAAAKRVGAPHRLPEKLTSVSAIT